MPTKLSFTPNLTRHLDCPDTEVEGETLRAVLEAYFASNPRARGYVLDDQGAVRRHVVIFLNQQLIQDRATLSDVVGDGDGDGDQVFVMQAQSGG